jgi:hypothetical protein
MTTSGLVAMTANVATPVLSLRAKRSNLAAMEKPCLAQISGEVTLARKI